MTILNRGYCPSLDTWWSVLERESPIQEDLARVLVKQTRADTGQTGSRPEQGRARCRWLNLFLGSFFCSYKGCRCFWQLFNQTQVRSLPCLASDSVTQCSLSILLKLLDLSKKSDGFLGWNLDLSSCSMHFSIQNGSDGKQTKAGQDAGEAALVDRGSRVLGASGHIPPVHPHTPPWILFTSKHHDEYCSQAHITKNIVHKQTPSLILFTSTHHQEYCSQAHTTMYIGPCQLLEHTAASLWRRGCITKTNNSLFLASWRQAPQIIYLNWHIWSCSPSAVNKKTKTKILKFSAIRENSISRKEW